MLARAKSLLGVAAGGRQLAMDACLAFISNVSRDIAEANQELDEFFGVSHSKSVPNIQPSIASRSGLGVDSPYAASVNSPAGTPAGAAVPGGLTRGSNCGSGAAAGGHDGSDGVLPLPFGADIVNPAQGLPPAPQQPRLTHIDSSGSAAMVDVSQKAVTVREAQASCTVTLGAAYELVASNSLAKGDVLKVAQLAGICGAKATASLIPLCHNIPISKVDVQLHLDPGCRSVVVRALARTDGKTGVEMEALTAAAVAALTVYDMCKAAAKDLVVGGLQLDYKSGGRSGTYLREGLRRADLLPSARPPL